MANKEDNLEEVFIGNNTFLRAHKRENCANDCPLHGPSRHHMIPWPLHWRDDRGIFERICPHGIGHPDPDTMAYIEKTKGRSVYEDELVHGCDGCCIERKVDN